MNFHWRRQRRLFTAHAFLTFNRVKQESDNLFERFPYFYQQMVLRSILYIVAVVLLIGWLIGFFWFRDRGILLHILLVLAIVSGLLGFFRKNEYE